MKEVVILKSVAHQAVETDVGSQTSPRPPEVAVGVVTSIEGSGLSSGSGRHSRVLARAVARRYDF